MKTILCLIFCLISLYWISCSSQLGRSEWEKIEDGIQLQTHNYQVRIQFYTSKIVRVVKWPLTGQADKTSLSVIMSKQLAVRIAISENDNWIFLNSDKLWLKVGREDGHIEYFGNDSLPFVKESGRPVFDPVVYDGDSGYSVQQKFELKPEEAIYGLGQHQDGYFNYRGKQVVLVQANTEAMNPFLISIRNYGILWDNYSKTVFTDSTDGAGFWSDMGDNLDYYFIAGENMDQVISGYRQLTGPAPMYGKWAYGYWQSKEHYHTQAELMGVAEKYRRLGIPIDNMIQDWDYWNGAENWSGMFFDKTLFPHPKQMCDRLHRMNYHIIISIWPALGPNTEIYADMARQGFLYKPVGWAGFKYYDAFNPQANALYLKYLKHGLYSQGLDGWWIDSTEPDVVNAMTKASSEYELKKMGSNWLGSWGRFLNAFSLVMTDALYQDWRRETSERRAYILTRSTYAGQQRNAATTWSGDIGASWDVYRRQIPAGLNHCMSGIPYWTFDIGAFVLGAYQGVFMQGGKDPAYQELYNRMFQFGAFSPVLRSHGSETPREIWEFGEFTPALIKFDRLRYRLMSYIYSLAWMVTSQDYTMMRGLPMDFPSDSETYNISDQFMFGPAIMVCPVSQYMYYRPPEPSVPIGSEYFQTPDGKPGLLARYFKDTEYQVLGKETIDPNIDFIWYTGRPDYVTDSTFAVRWQGKLIPQETGKHQFHLISYDNKRIILNGDTLHMVYTSVEQYSEPVSLEAGKSYDIIVEVENRSTGAARMRLFWKTPGIFARETAKENREKSRQVYLPVGYDWYDFWTGMKYQEGSNIKADAPIEKMPLFVKAGSIIPMGPFIQYTGEKAAEPIELRIYPGADGDFFLYEDEGDNYNYENGVHFTIPFHWDDNRGELTIGRRQGKFPGMLAKRTFKIVLISENRGTGVEISKNYDQVVAYDGQSQTVKF